MSVYRTNAKAPLSMVPAYKKPKSVDDMLRARDLFDDFTRIAKAHHVTLDECYSPSRYPHIVRARCAIWRHLRNIGWSTTAIAAITGHEHSTVIAGLKKSAA